MVVIGLRLEWLLGLRLGYRVKVMVVGLRLRWLGLRIGWLGLRLGWFIRLIKAMWVKAGSGYI